MLYFDHAASTPLEPEVIDTIAEIMRRHYGNPSSLHQIGAEAEQLVQQARELIAHRWKVHPAGIVFTSGGTESNNLAIFGAVTAFPNRGRHLITSQIEHSSVYECFRRLEQLGYEITYLSADQSGAVRVEDFTAALRPDTSLVSLMVVNNETGRIQPIEQIGAILSNRPQTLFHVDAVQAAGKLLLQPEQLGIDLMTISAHKFGGPKGSGVLYCRNGLALSPLLFGGGQQDGLRPGTENVPLIVGLAKAYRIADEQMVKRRVYLSQLKDIFISRISTNPSIRLTGTEDFSGMVAHIVHFRVPGVRAEVLLHAMEQKGFYISSQSACSSGEEKPSRVLKAMGMMDDEAKSGIRISFSHDHTKQEVEQLAAALLETTDQLLDWMG